MSSILSIQFQPMQQVSTELKFPSQRLLPLKQWLTSIYVMQVLLQPLMQLWLWWYWPEVLRLLLCMLRLQLYSITTQQRWSPSPQAPSTSLFWPSLFQFGFQQTQPLIMGHKCWKKNYHPTHYYSKYYGSTLTSGTPAEYKLPINPTYKSSDESYKWPVHWWPWITVHPSFWDPQTQ